MLVSDCQVLLHRCCIAVALLTSLALTAPAMARQYAIDYMDLATVLAYDGEFDRAREALAEINPRNPSYDYPRILTIEALILNGENKLDQAVDKFREAISATRVKKYVFNKDINQETVRREALELLHQQLAEILYKLDRCDETLDALLAAREAGQIRPQLYAIKADCQWRTGLQDAALNTLDNGYRKYLDAIALLKQKFAYLAEGGMYIAASAVARQLLKGGDLAEADYLGFAKVFDGSGQTGQAIDLLQNAKALFPQNPQFCLFLAHIYLQKQQYLVAAGLFEQAAALDPGYWAEAAEVYRRAGQLATALRLNSLVTDERRKAAQQIAIFIELEEFEKVTALETELHRLGLLDQEKVRYALAYALFRSGDYQRAENQLRQLSSADYYEKALAMRQSIETCQDLAAQCE